MKFLKNNWFFFSMILGIVLGIIVGFAWPGATALEPLGTLFINMMFCVVVPMVFFSISSSIANMKSAKRAGKLMGTTVITFMCTTIIASVLMYVLVRFIPIYIGEPA
ncbi:MAG: dicarboxylate/amino acid:cation symporter, partial [Oscillospiraceae bacterium]|nr:dicarboxylate/amino acid:cation symporter [Oscillospiraceae bacterium]